MKKAAYLIIFLLVTVTAGYGQFWSRVYYVSGKILDKDTHQPVPYVLVTNISKGNSTQSDTAGRFLIAMLKTDTLEFSSIGYKTFYWTMSNLKTKSKHISITVYLKKQIYNLPSVNIYAVRWKAFVYEVAHTKAPVNETQERIKKWFSQAVPVSDLQALAVAGRGEGFTFGGKTKYERELQKIQQMKEYAEIEKEVEKKFNPQLVSKITGLKGEELDKFMHYLNFDRDFILKTPEYDLIIIIKQIYKLYKEGILPNKRRYIHEITPFAPVNY